MLYMALQNKEDTLKAEKLYNHYSRLMFSLAYDILHNQTLAEDALQQSFIKVMDNINKIDEVENPKTKNLLAIISRNIALNIYKKENHIEKSELFDTISDKVDIESIIIEEDELDRLTELICSLKPIYRDVIILRYSQGYSIKEIAKLLDTKTKTIQKRIERGKEKLKELLNKEGKYYE